MLAGILGFHTCVLRLSTPLQRLRAITRSSSAAKARASRRGSRKVRDVVAIVPAPAQALLGHAVGAVARTLSRAIEFNSAASAVLRKEATGTPICFNSDVAATAKRALKKGEILDGEGGFCVWGKQTPAAISLSEGYLPLGLAHNVKLNAVVFAPFGIALSAAFEYVSGYYWEKLGYVPFFGGYYAYPEGRGSRKTPGHTFVDLSVEREFALPAGLRLSLRMDIFNLLNQQRPIAYVKEDIPIFGAVWSRQLPRQARAMIKIKW